MEYHSTASRTIPASAASAVRPIQRSLLAASPDWYSSGSAKPVSRPRLAAAIDGTASATSRSKAISPANLRSARE